MTMFLVNKHTFQHGEITHEYEDGSMRIESPTLKTGGALHIKKNELKHWERVSVEPLGADALQEEIEL